jgi:hypothetical protein
MITLNVAPSQLDALLMALRFLQENLDRLPLEFIELHEGQLPDEAQIDNLCAGLTATAFGSSGGSAWSGG